MDNDFKINGNIISYKTIDKIIYENDKEIQFHKDSNIEKYKTRSIEVLSWFKNDGDYCNEGEKICTLKIRRITLKNLQIQVVAEKSGRIFLNNKYTEFQGKSIADNDSIYQIDNDYFFNKSLLEEDKFNQTLVLKWSTVGANNSNEEKLNGFFHTMFDNGQRLFFTINNIHGKDFIVLNFPQKEFDIKTGDRFQIRLDSNDIINFNFSQNSYFSFETKAYNLKRIKENKAIVKNKDLQLLANNKIVDWQITFQNGKLISGFNPFGQGHAYSDFQYLQEKIQLLFIDYLAELDRIDYYTPTDEDTNNEIKEECYLYLMIDTTNNFHKIGISNQPKYRERTLQSEKPSIELIASKKFPSRNIALSIEKALHETFKLKNIRGEWFDLNQIDINEIIQTLK